MVERHVANVNVEGSNPFARFQPLHLAPYVFVRVAGVLAATVTGDGRKTGCGSHRRSVPGPAVGQSASANTAPHRLVADMEDGNAPAAEA